MQKNDISMPIHFPDASLVRHLALLLLLLSMGCPQGHDQNSRTHHAYPSLKTLSDYSFASQDSVINQSLSKFGFGLTYPRAYSLTFRNYAYSTFTLDRHDSTFASVQIHPFDTRDFQFDADQLRLNPDSALWYAQSRSTFPFFSDGDVSTGYSRVDSTKLFTTYNSLRVIVVYQTLIEKYWGTPEPGILPYQETRIAPFFWVDLWNSRNKMLLQIMQPKPESDTLAINRLVVGLVQSVKAID